MTHSRGFVVKVGGQINAICIQHACVAIAIALSRTHITMHVMREREMRKEGDVFVQLIKCSKEPDIKTQHAHIQHTHTHTHTHTAHYYTSTHPSGFIEGRMWISTACSSAVTLSS